MDDSEIVVLVAGAILAVVAMALTTQAPMHRIYFRRNPGPGIVRAAIILSLVWVLLVSLVWADESVQGVYVLFYLVLGYAAVKFFGHAGSRLLGLRYRVDVLERRNVAAALVIGAFTLATGLIFGGSLWGDADPAGDSEGGWWIVGAFFLLGWICLVAAYRIYLVRERARFPKRGGSLRRSRELADGKAAALFLLAAAVVLTDAVAGDFWGWRHGILTFGVLAGLLLVHEFFAGVAQAGETGPVRSGAPPAAGGAHGNVGGPGEGSPPARKQRARAVEGIVYVALAAAAWALSRFLDAFLGGG